MTDQAQQTMPVETPTFMTDEYIARELQAIASGLHDLQARIPSLARRLEAIAGQFPQGT